ncbi:MAG: SDR family NAD(P)-dependent oxidoreductase [Promethearchaeota archaeon]
MELDGKVVIVGGNLGKMKGDKFVKGLGAVIAEKVKGYGAKVVVTDLDEGIVGKCASELGVKGIYKDILKDRSSHEIEVDHPRKGKVKDVEWDDNPALDLVKEVVAEFGKVDVLVNNWDYYKKGKIEKVSGEDFDEMREKNITPVFHMLAAVRNQFAGQHAKDKNDWPKVVNVFSFVGKAGMSMGSIFSAMKGSMIGITKGIGREFGRFAITNSVAYGPLKEKKMQGPEDRVKKQYMVTSTDYGQNQDITMDKVANVVAFMASPLSNGMNAQTISVDGGLWLKLEQ